VNTGVYVILCSANGKRYVGSAAVSLTKRWTQHLRKLRRGCHPNQHIQAAWNLYGEEAFSFSVAEVCLPEHCVAQEQVYLDYYKSFDPNKGFNVRSIAESNRGMKLSESAKRKLAEANRGKKASEETRRKMSQTRTGKKAKPETIAKLRAKTNSEETRQKMREASSRRGPISEETRQKMSAGQRGRKHSDETKARISKASKGFKHSEETKRHLSEMKKGNMSAEHKAAISARHTGAVRSPETIAKLKEAAARRDYKAEAKARWADPVYRAKQHASRLAREERKCQKN